MEQLHAHEVLHMMEGNSYTELSLREAIIQKFGEQQRFFTCSANNMDVDTLIAVSYTHLTLPTKLEV